jgi:hypothetical protein
MPGFARLGFIFVTFITIAAAIVASLSKLLVPSRFYQELRNDPDYSTGQGTAYGSTVAAGTGFSP